MTPSLAKAIRLAQHRLRGDPLSAEEVAEQARKEAISDFEIYVASRMSMRIEMDLFAHATWNWDGRTTSVDFSVDEHRFRLVRQRRGCQLLLADSEPELFVAEIPDERDGFEDHLLVGVGDALQEDSGT